MATSVPVSLPRVAPTTRPSIVSAALSLGTTWLRRMRERSCLRRQLAALFAVTSARDLNDMPVCWSQIEHEANKPFWQE